MMSLNESDLSKCPMHSLFSKTVSFFTNIFYSDRTEAPNFSSKSSKTAKSSSESFLEYCDNMPYYENLKKGPLTSNFGCMPSKHPNFSLPEPLYTLNSSIPSLWQEKTFVEFLKNLKETHFESFDEKLHSILACVLGNVIQSHYNNQNEKEPENRENAPEWLMNLWDSVCEALDRKQFLQVFDEEKNEFLMKRELIRFSFVSYNDIIHNNWRLEGRKPEEMYEAGEIRVENPKLDLLTKTIGDQSERNFYLAQIEMAIRSKDLYLTLARAQTAVLQNDQPKLSRYLCEIIDTIREVSDAFQKIKPNHYSSTFVDPVEWARGIGSLGKPFREKIYQNGKVYGPVQGLNGFGSPLVHVLDIFTSRKKYECPFGKQALFVRHSLPELWQRFFKNLENVDVKDFIKKEGSVHLKGLLIELEEVYNSFLESHMLKLYTYLEITFKNRGIGGMKGFISGKKWRFDGHELALSNGERADAKIQKKNKRIVLENVSVADKASVIEIAYDLPYHLGDHVAVLAPNTEKDVEMLLELFACDGDEGLQFDDSKVNKKEWMNLARFMNKSERNIPIKTVFKYGKISKISENQFKILKELEKVHNLKEEIENNFSECSQLSLIELLQNFVRPFSKISMREIFSYSKNDTGIHILDFVEPQDFRYYSIASENHEENLKILVSKNSFQRSFSDRVLQRMSHLVNPLCCGVASNFLFSVKKGQKIYMKIIHNSNFIFPKNEEPLIMISGGSGISPFRGFLKKREQENNGENYLFFSTRKKNEFYFSEELKGISDKNMLEVKVCYTQEPEEKVPQSNNFEILYQKRIDELLNQSKELLRNLVLNKNGVIFVCGNNSFANKVIETLKNILESNEKSRDDLIYKLMMNNKLNVEAFSTTESVQKQIFLSDVTKLDRFWTIIDKKVYNMENFHKFHVGGADLIDLYRGCDASDAFKFIGHHKSPMIMAQLSMFEIGHLCQPTLLKCVQPVYEGWKKLVLKLVELRNSWRNDMKFFKEENLKGNQNFKLSEMCLSHSRFFEIYFNLIFDDEIFNLWDSIQSLSNDYNFLSPEFIDKNLKKIISEIEISREYKILQIDQFNKQILLPKIHKTEKKTLIEKLFKEKEIIQEFFNILIEKMSLGLAKFERENIHSMKCFEPSLEILLSFEQNLRSFKEKLLELW